MLNIVTYIRTRIKVLYDKYDTKEMQFISTLFSVLSTVVMTYLTVMMSIANDRMAEANDRMADSNDMMSISENQAFVLARYQHTFALCQRFGETYEDVENIERYEYKIWEENDPEYEFNPNNKNFQDYRQIKERWAVTDSTGMEAIQNERLQYLRNNSFFQQVLQYFEEAKILHKKKLLDVDAFENDLMGVMYRLHRTQYPSIDEYIQYIRSCSSRINKSEIWDGYYYCAQNIMSQYYHLPQSGTIVKMFVTEGDKVKVGDKLLSYKLSGSDKEEILTAGQNGEIMALYVSPGEECDIKTFLLRISQRDYFTEAGK